MRIFRRGLTKFWWVPAIADVAAPTVAEITAGVDMTPDIAEVNGFAFANSPIPTPDMASTFTGNIPGEDTTEDSSLIFYEEDDTNPLHATLAKGATGHVVVFPIGIAGATPAAADTAEVWPVQSTGPRREYSSGNDPGRWSTGFAASTEPEFSATVAA